MDLHARLRLKNARHKNGDFSGSIEFAGALALTFGKLAQQVFVSSTQDVRFHIIESQPVLAQDLHQLREPSVIHDPLPGGGLVEVPDVDDALQFRVLPCHGPHCICKVFAKTGGPSSDGRPTSSLRDVEPD